MVVSEKKKHWKNCQSCFDFIEIECSFFDLEFKSPQMVNHLKAPKSKRQLRGSKTSSAVIRTSWSTQELSLKPTEETNRTTYLMPTVQDPEHIFNNP